jgi:RNA polymerase sigma-70 factor (ECF subfamily)
MTARNRKRIAGHVVDVGSPNPDRAARFRSLYADAYADLLRFAQRRVPHAEAEDVVADAFLAAWRRLDDAPPGADDQRAWLFGIARHCLLNTRRGEDRREALAVRVAVQESATPTGDGVAPAAEADTVAALVDLATAWRGLSLGQQEALSLTVFEDLTSAQAAAVLGITATAYRLRLLRARRALRVRLGRSDLLLRSSDQPAPTLETLP